MARVISVASGKGGDRQQRGFCQLGSCLDTALILNRVSGRAHVNVPQLKKLLKEYVGGDQTLEPA